LCLSSSTRLPYPPLFRSRVPGVDLAEDRVLAGGGGGDVLLAVLLVGLAGAGGGAEGLLDLAVGDHQEQLPLQVDLDHLAGGALRSEEHTSELQSREKLVC